MGLMNERKEGQKKIFLSSKRERDGEMKKRACVKEKKISWKGDKGNREIYLE